jgi:transcriptional regulator with XRE-family HTH domain
MESFGELIRDERINQALSYRQLAKKVSAGGIAVTTAAMLNVIEKEIKPCSYRLAIAIAVALELDLELSLKALFMDRTTLYVEREKNALYE